MPGRRVGTAKGKWLTFEEIARVRAWQKSTGMKSTEVAEQLGISTSTFVNVLGISATLRQECYDKLINLVNTTQANEPPVRSFVNVKLSEQLIARIRKEFPELAKVLPEGVVLKRTHAGSRDLAAGEMSWISFAPGIPRVVQSCDSMARCLKASKLTLIDSRSGFEIVAE